jgi:hypothetical protein
MLTGLRIQFPPNPDSRICRFTATPAKFKTTALAKRNISPLKKKHDAASSRLLQIHSSARNGYISLGPLAAVAPFKKMHFVDTRKPLTKRVISLLRPRHGDRLPRMNMAFALLASVLTFSIPAFGQTPGDQSVPEGDYKISLPAHLGQLKWHADGFRITELSAKPKGQEEGFRGIESSGRLTFLGFLFLVSEQAPLTSAKCRDGALEDQKHNPTLKVLGPSAAEADSGIPVALATYTAPSRDGKKWYNVRGFAAVGDICGDLDFYSETPISADDPDLRKIFSSYRLDPNYAPQFNDLLLYAQILYQHQMYQAAAPIYEQALAKLGNDPSQQKMRRVTTDQAGMSYGIAGDIRKARAIFTAAIVDDPDYPMYYYNLACADAEEKKLADARIHLQQAFARKQNMISGENFPDPTKDDSFLPYKNNKEFWTFLEQLR